MNKIIPYGRQEITNEDIAAVTRVLKADFLTQGPEIRNFESAFADYVGATYAVAVSNGTAALHLSNLALGVEPGQKVITVPITFAASANATLYCGADIDFVDIDPVTYTMDLDQLERKLSGHPKGTYAGVVPVDFAGYPVDLERLRGMADEYGMWILEDACHAPGGAFKDSEQSEHKCGSGEFADLSIFSFHPVKHIASGEGGMITTNRKDLYDIMMRLRTHGITKDSELIQENHGPWYYEMIELGFNYRLTDIQAALGASQLTEADNRLKRRREIADRYNEALKDCSGYVLPHVDPRADHAYHLYVIKSEHRKELYQFLRANGIYAQVHYIPVHLNPYYRNLGWKKGDFPVAEAYYDRALSLPMFPSLSNEDQDYVIGKLREFAEQHI